MILVTTPNGKVGSELVKQLLAHNVPVRVGAHTLAKAQQAFPSAEVVPFDYNDATSVQAALRGVTALYLASPGDAPAGPVQQAVDLAVASGVQRIVRLSALGVEHGDSPLRQIERHIEASDLAWTFLRPSWFMQNYSTFNAQGIREQSAIFEPSADGKTGFVDARDIAAVAMQALISDGHAGQAYAITGGQAYDRYEVAAVISAAIGKEVRYFPISDEQYQANMLQFGAPAEYVGFMSQLYGMVRAGYTATVTDDVQRVTGRAPITFEQFAHDHREAWL